MKQRIDWHSWKFSDFQINFTHQYNHSSSTCGGCCVSMITGESPRRVDDRAGWKGDCKTGLMTKYLQKKGYDVMPLGPRTICNSLKAYQWNAPTLSEDHVVLIGAMTDKVDASWFLFHQRIVWHNFERWTDSPLFLLRNPAEDVLLIREK